MTNAHRLGLVALLFQPYAKLYKAMGGGWVDDAEQLVRNSPAGNGAGK